MPRPAKGSIRRGGSGGGLANLLMAFFGGNVGINPDAAAATTLAKGGVLEGNPGETMITTDRYKALTAPGATDLFKANNWLSRPTASQLNAQFGLNRALAEAAVGDALKLKAGEVPLNLEQKKGETDIELEYQKAWQKMLTTEAGQRAFLTFLGTNGLPTDVDTIRQYTESTKEPIITKIAAEAGSAGNAATLAGTKARFDADTLMQMEPEYKAAAQDQFRMGATTAGFELNNLLKTLKARQAGIEQAPDIARLNAIKNQFYPVPAGTQILDTATGAVRVPATFKPDSTDKLVDLFLNGGAGLTNKSSIAPVAVPTQPPSGQLILKDGVLYDLRTGKPVHKVSPFE